MNTDSTKKLFLVLYHAACTDGFGAAWAAWKKLGEKADYLPVQYGQPLPDVSGRDLVCVLDFSYPSDVLAKLVDACPTLVIDHHKTFAEQMGWDPSLRRESVSDRIHTIYDPTQSGAVLAWQWFFGNYPVPRLLEYVQDRDLWKWVLPDSRAVNAAIRSYPQDFEVWGNLEARCLCCCVRTGLPRVELVNEGTAILRAQDQMVELICRHARPASFAGGATGLQVNSPVLQSEVAGRLAAGQPLGACWYEDAEGHHVFSLRSDKDGVDVSAVAKQYGGGGHKHAAGFRIKP